jgi:hypothetical protein
MAAVLPLRGRNAAIRGDLSAGNYAGLEKDEYKIDKRDEYEIDKIDRER